MTRRGDAIRWAAVLAWALLVLLILGTLARVEAAPVRAGAEDSDAGLDRAGVGHAGNAGVVLPDGRPARRGDAPTARGSRPAPCALGRPRPTTGPGAPASAADRTGRAADAQSAPSAPGELDAPPLALRAGTEPGTGVRDVCRAQLAAWSPGARPANDRVSTCLRLAQLAEEAGPHAALTLAVAYEESHWSPADDEGAVRGACQLAACHCPGHTFRGCDLDAACAATVARLMSEEQGSAVVVLRRWLRGYRAGRAGPIDAAGEAFAAAIRQTAEDIEQQLAVRAAGER